MKNLIIVFMFVFGCVVCEEVTTPSLAPEELAYIEAWLDMYNSTKELSVDVGRTELN